MPTSAANLKKLLFLTAAPMAGISSPIYRLLNRRMGATCAYTEMVSSKGLARNNIKTRSLLAIDPAEPPVAAQIFGTDPKEMADAAAFVEQAGFDLVDINMGCPVRKVAGHGAGVALMNDVKTAQSIVKAMVNAVNIPVSAKIRSGWSSESLNALPFAEALQDAGLSAISVHPRTREQGYSGKADWSVIAAIKERLQIPVIGNGDVNDGKSALEMSQSTGCDGIMIGRAALGRPWIFQEVRAALENRPLPEKPTDKEILGLFVTHFDALKKQLGDIMAVRNMKKFGAWYTRGHRGAPAARAKLHRCTSEEEMKEIVKNVLLGT